jgi:hypothetical protein
MPDDFFKILQLTVELSDVVSTRSHDFPVQSRRDETAGTSPGRPVRPHCVSVSSAGGPMKM